MSVSISPVSLRALPPPPVTRVASKPEDLPTESTEVKVAVRAQAPTVSSRSAQVVQIKLSQEAQAQSQVVRSAQVAQAQTTALRSSLDARATRVENNVETARAEEVAKAAAYTADAQQVSQTRSYGLDITA